MACTTDVKYSTLSNVLLIITILLFLVTLGFGVTALFEYFFSGDVVLAKGLGVAALFVFVLTFAAFLATSASASRDAQRRQA